jgi:hypothetical protein
MPAAGADHDASVLGDVRTALVMSTNTGASSAAPDSASWRALSKASQAAVASPVRSAAQPCSIMAALSNPMMARCRHLSVRGDR